MVHEYQANKNFWTQGDVNKLKERYEAVITGTKAAASKMRTETINLIQSRAKEFIKDINQIAVSII